MTPRKSRTAAKLAADLSMDPGEVQETFDAFPRVFRKSKTTDSGGHAFYTIYARYALRPYDAREDDDAELRPVRPEILGVLLEFITQAARGEQEHARFTEELRSAESSAARAVRSADRAAFLALLAAGLATVGSISVHSSGVVLVSLNGGRSPLAGRRNCRPTRGNTGWFIEALFGSLGSVPQLPSWCRRNACRELSD